MAQTHLWPLVLLVLVGAALALDGVRLRWLLFRRRVRARRRQLRAQRGERRAQVLLEAKGYRVEGFQVASTWTVLVDGTPTEFEVCADYIVRRGLRRFVAEVKTGACAPSLTTAATRRQLLEYALAFDVDGTLLVDAEGDQIHEVSFFRASAPRATGSPIAWLVAGVLAGLAFTW